MIIIINIDKKILIITQVSEYLFSVHLSEHVEQTFSLQ